MENAVKYYNIGEVCEIINSKGIKDFHAHNLRYIEKVMDGIFEIRRDEYLNRLYNEQDILKLEEILKLRSDGMNYGAIKAKFSHENNESQVNNDNIIPDFKISNNNNIIKEDFLEMQDGMEFNIDNIKALMSEVVNSSIKQTMEPKFNSIITELKELRSDNEELRESLEKKQDIHYKMLDERLTQWREEHFENKKSWVKRFFGKKKIV